MVTGASFQQTHFTGPPFVRVLARLSGLDAPVSDAGFAERLGQWLHWTDAVSLSGLLDAAPPLDAASRPSSTDAEAASFEAARTELARLQRSLAQAIAGPSAGRRAIADEADAAAEDFAVHRRWYLAQQQVMASAIGPLRQRLRSRLLATSPALAHLAELDAALESVLAERQRDLLQNVPALLERRFDRLRQGVDATPAEPWPQRFRQDLQALLTAELALRLQPLHGLVEALAPPPPCSS